MTGKEVKEMLLLIKRTPDIGGGWKQCSKIVFDNLVTHIPKCMIEIKTHEDNIYVKLAEELDIYIKWDDFIAKI